jgi:hypothetical protein
MKVYDLPENCIYQRFNFTFGLTVCELVHVKPAKHLSECAKSLHYSFMSKIVVRFCFVSQTIVSHLRSQSVFSLVHVCGYFLKLQGVQHALETTYLCVTAVVCVVINSFPGSSLAAAVACCCGGFHVKWETVQGTDFYWYVLFY